MGENVIFPASIQERQLKCLENISMTYVHLCNIVLSGCSCFQFFLYSLPLFSLLWHLLNLWWTSSYNSLCPFKHSIIFFVIRSFWIVLLHILLHIFILLLYWFKRWILMDWFFVSFNGVQRFCLIKKLLYGYESVATL